MLQSIGLQTDTTERLSNSREILSPRTQNKPRARTCVDSPLYVTPHTANLADSCSAPRLTTPPRLGSNGRLGSHRGAEGGVKSPRIQLINDDVLNPL